MLGCDSPADKAHKITCQGETFESRTCPRKLMEGAGYYFNVWNWREKGALDQKYAPGTLPAYIAEALDIIDSEYGERQARQLQDMKRKR